MMFKFKVFSFTIGFMIVMFIFGCAKKEPVNEQNKEPNKETVQGTIKDGAVSINNPAQISYDMSFKDQLIKKITISLDKKKYVFFSADYNNMGVQSNTLTIFNDGNDNIFVINYLNGNRTGFKFKLADLNNLFKDSAILVFDRLYNKKLLDRMTDKDSTQQKYRNLLCDVYNFQTGGVTGKYYIYKDFVMIGADFADGRFNIKTTSFDPNAVIDEKIFNLPKDIEFKEGNELINKYDQREIKDIKKDDSWIVNNMIFLPGLDAVKLLFAE